MSRKVVTLDPAGTKVFRGQIFVEDHSRRLVLLQKVNFMCEMILAIMTFVVQVRDVHIPKNEKSVGSGQIKLLKLEVASQNSDLKWTFENFSFLFSKTDWSIQDLFKRTTDLID